MTGGTSVFRTLRETGPPVVLHIALGRWWPVVTIGLPLTSRREFGPEILARYRTLRAPVGQMDT